MIMYYDAIETGRRIQKLRKGKGLTQEQLASLLKVTDRHKLASEIKASLESGADAVVLDINKRISEGGFTWALDKPTGAAYEIQPARAVKSAYKLLGGPAFSRMLELLAGAWHGSQSSLKSGMIAGTLILI